MFDEFPSCDRCNNDNASDGPICRKCQLEVNGEIGKRQAAEYYSAQGEAAELAEVMKDWPGRGPDEDGETFEPMSDEEMKAAQARNYGAPLVDPFATEAELVRKQWPNVFDSPALTLGATW